MAKKSSAVDANVQHVVAVRMRVIGVGNLQLTLSDLDDITSYNMVPLVMAAANNIEPNRLANFQSQRVRLTGQVTEVDEYFSISKIIIYAKAIAMEYPG